MTILRNAVCATVASAKPSYRYGSQARMPLQSNAAAALVQFGLPQDLQTPGATILSATLRLYQSGAWGGSRTVSVQRNAARWLVSKATWNNKPATAGDVTTITQADTADSAVLTFDVTGNVSSWVSGGSSNFGWRVFTSDATRRYLRGAGASSGKPSLEIVYTFAPQAPTSLHPSFGAVSVAAPVLRFDQSAVGSLQVQVDAAANGTTPGFDSGWVASTVPEFALAGSSYAGLAVGSTTSWRVRTQNGSGQTSPWSDWASFPRVAKPALSIDDPTDTVYESTPPFNATMVGMSAVQWIVTPEDDPTKTLYDSGKLPSTTGDLTPPSPVFVTDGASYTVTVRAWDNVAREATPGDPAYTTTSVDTTLVYDADGPDVDWIDAVQPGAGPWVDVRWGWSATEPDGWAVLRDDVVVQVYELAADASVDGNLYAHRDFTAAPDVRHVYSVAPVINGVTSAATKVQGITPSTSGGLWLVDPNTGVDVPVWTEDNGTWALPEDATVLNPIGATEQLRIVTSMRGYEGALGGVVVDTPTAPDHSAFVCERRLMAFKGDSAAIYRLAAGHINIPVRLFEVTTWPHPLSTADLMVINASYGFYQVGELSFAVNL